MKLQMHDSAEPGSSSESWEFCVQKKLGKLARAQAGTKRLSRRASAKALHGLLTGRCNLLCVSKLLGEAPHLI